MKTKILFSLVLIALLMSCAKEFSDNDYLVQAPESFDALMAQGWLAFETRHYDIAVETFAAAAERKATLPEVYLGLGWSSMRNLNLENGRVYLGSAISFAFLDAANEAQIIRDAQSGLAGIALIEAEYETAITYVDGILEADPNYTFSHDTSINPSALKRIRMTATYYQGDYSDAFQEVLDLGLSLSSVIRETPSSGNVTALAVVDSGTTMSSGVKLTSDWLKVTASAHGLKADDYVVFSGFSDGGNPNLTAFVGTVTRATGWKLKYIIDADNYLVTAVNPAIASLVSSITLSNAKYFEGTGIAVATPGSTLDGILQINIYNDRQLIQVNSVSALVDDGASYSVTDIDEGGNQLHVFGNPVFSAGQRVAVDYYHTPNFALFLSELIDLVSTIQ